MTSLIIKEFDMSEAKSTAEFERFQDWCIDLGKTSLDEWLLQKSYDFYHLLGSGVISFESSLIVSMPATAVITEKGQKFIADYSHLFQDHIERCDFWVVTDSHGLECEINYLMKSGANERELYKNLHLLKYGSEAEKSDDELDFRFRGIIGGPYCDIEELNKFPKENLEKKFCSWCGASLHLRPSFSLKEYNLCFRCQSIIHAKLVKLESCINEIRLDCHYESIRNLKLWHEKFSAHMGSKSIKVRIKEIFGQDSMCYVNDFIVSNPKPEIVEYVEAVSTVKLRLNEKDVLVKNMLSIKKRDNNECQLCYAGKETVGRGQLEVHHILPQAKLGKNYHCNLVTLCSDCHDHQVWFGHKRAYASKLSVEPHVEWPWNIMPQLLILDDDELVNIEGLFDGEVVVYE